MFSCEFFEISKNSYLENISGQLLLDLYISESFGVSCILFNYFLFTFCIMKESDLAICWLENIGVHAKKHNCQPSFL